VAIPEALLAEVLLKVLQLLRRKALRKPKVSVQEGRLRRFGLSRGNTDPGSAGWGFQKTGFEKKERRESPVGTFL